MSQKIINKRSSVITEDGKPKLPSSDVLDYGEIAINYADGVETLSIKNSANEIIEFKSKDYVDNLVNNNIENTINITYAELVLLRDNANLKPGQQYRIIDYVTTTIQENTQSAGHQFDVIVTADDEKTLNEVARACLHDEDTYFADSDLNAWQIWYCLDNDTERFAWADDKILAYVYYYGDGSSEELIVKANHDDSAMILDRKVAYIHDKEDGTQLYITDEGFVYDESERTVGRCRSISYSGKGVIYRMIDEFGNDCPYDFKNIQFIRYELNAPETVGREPWMAQLSTNVQAQFSNNNLPYIWGGFAPEENRYWEDTYENIYSTPTGNKKAFYTFSTVINDVVIDHSLLQGYCYSNTIKEYITSKKQYLNNNVFLNTSKTSTCYSNSFGNDCRSNSFGNRCQYNSFGDGCNYNSFGDSCSSNSFGYYCDSNSFGNNCRFNSFGNNCYYNSFEYTCYSNSFGNSCNSNSFGKNCSSNSFGNGYKSNSFGNYCYSNSFGNDCQSNSFGYDCNYNTFGNSCESNSFGSNCYSNSFGYDCFHNSFGDTCYYNSFGNNCNYNSFGYDCSSNSFGNSCDYNSFGDGCNYNSFGNNCFHNSFRISADKAATLKDYVQYNHFDDSCSYNIIWNSETSNNTVLLKNINVNRGVCGTSSLYNIINIDVLNSEQEINVNQVDGIVSIGDILSIKYESLKTLRDNSQLIPGRQYRIIDYVTTTSQENTQSAGHQFDIIVTALGEYTLSEEAQAIQNINDGYFDDSNLSAWKIWYSIDNDTNRFEWAGSEITTSEEVEVTTYDSSECTINSELIDGDVFITPFNFESCVWVDANGDGTAYAGESNHDEAELVYEWGYFTDENDNTQLCLYKSDAGLYEEEGQPDYDDKYLYRGVITVDGTDYDYWQKWDANNESISIADTGDYVYATTARIVSNPEAYSFETTNETIETVIQLNPKGIIYRMIDEFNNDCPYDFKNIQFKHPNDTTTYPDYYYTFSTVIDGAVIDHSLLQGYCYSNTIKEYITSKKQYLNNNVFLNTSKTSTCYSNSFGNSCYKNSFGNDCNYNSFGSRCDSNSFGDSCFSNSFGSRCRSNSFRNECYSNSFGDDCDYNSFGSYCNYDSFGHNCDSNSFGIFCYYNSFGNRCYSNSFGSRCDYNSFGNNCYSNSFRDECYSNSFGYECYSNSFGYYCNSNSFGNRCSSNSFGKNCSSNSFGNNYSSNSFGIYCRSNSFGDSCFYNSFGNYCGYNSFGNYCGYNSFRVSADKAATLKDYVRYNHFDDSCSYNIIWNSDTTSSSIQLQNINVNRGVCGNGSSYNMINITVLNRDYEIQVYRDEGGNICIDTFPVPLTTNDIDLIWAKYFNGGGYGSGSASAIANDDVINSIGVGDYDETEQ